MPLLVPKASARRTIIRHSWGCSCALSLPKVTNRFRNGNSCTPRRVMFPDPDHSPTQLSQRPVHSPVPSDIALELERPIVRVGLRWLAMEGAGVPEAAINENRNSQRCKRDISSDNLATVRDGKVLPKSKSEPMKLRPQRPLRASVMGMIALHYRPDGLVGSRRGRNSPWRCRRCISRVQDLYPSLKPYLS